MKPELVAIHPQVENKEELFANFATQFGQIRPGIDLTEVSLGLSRREAAQTRGFGHGVAMPPQP